jgi:putative membrane protein
MSAAGDGRPAGAPTTLAVERTHLAWRRTALGLTGGGVAAAHVLQEFAGAAAWSIAVAAAVIATALAVASRRRNVDRIADGAGIDGRLVAVCASGVVALGLGALAFLLLEGS